MCFLGMSGEEVTWLHSSITGMGVVAKEEAYCPWRAGAEATSFRERVRPVWGGGDR